MIAAAPSTSLLRQLAPAWLALLPLLLSALAGCESDPPAARCLPGTQVVCDCGDQGEGRALCNEEGSLHECLCGGDVLLAGRIFSADTGKALGKVSVLAADGSETTSDADGHFQLQHAGGAGLVLSRDGYAATQKSLPAQASYVELFLKKIDHEVQFDADEGVRLRASDGLGVAVPKRVLELPSGKRATGELELEVSAVRAARRTELETLPSLHDARDGDRRGHLVVRTPVEVTARRDGRELGVASGQSIRVELPIQRADAPARMDLFSYDPDKAHWRKEGQARRTLSEEGRPVYRADLSHLSWWATGELVSDFACLEGCIETADGQPAAFASVTAHGVDHGTVTTVAAGADGCVSLQVKPDAQVSLTVQSVLGEAPAVIVETGGTGRAGGTGGTGGQCQQVEFGVLQLPASGPRAGADGCATGHDVCGDRCVAPLADAEHCGGCGDACGGSADRAQSCVDGRCRCVQGEERCGGSCVNTDGDRSHCGGCGQSCGDVEECVGGRCEPATCPAGHARCNAECVDTREHLLHCASCGGACGEGEACEGSLCVDASGAPPITMPDPTCESGSLDCGDGCVDVTANRTHCGRCDRACAEGDLCVDGRCQTPDPDAGPVDPACVIPADCDDGNPCTDDACTNDRCVYTELSAACDDGIACTVNDTCSAGSCAGTPDDALCDDGSGCTDDLCGATGCTSNNVCQLPEVCDAVLDVCMTCTLDAECNDSNPCTDETCDGPSGVCQRTFNTDPCDDGDACTQTDTCGGGVCGGTNPKDCSDGNPCTDDACNPSNGNCTNPPNSAQCDMDGSACTLDFCNAGVCSAGPGIDCDGGPCMDSVCNPGTGQCDNTPLANSTPCDSDAISCTNDLCDGAGACLHIANDAACDDANVCTTDTCNPTLGCDFGFNTSPCDDGNAGTSNDTCNEGICSGT